MTRREEKIRVLAWPARRNKINPYTQLLYDGMLDLGLVEEFTVRRLLFGRWDVWHFHWPDHILNDRRPLVAFFKLVVLYLLLHFTRWRGTRLIWTVHNLAAHDARYPRLERAFWKILIPTIDGAVHLSESGKMLALARFPRLSSIPSPVIPHGHYRDAYPEPVDRATARRALQIADMGLVMLSLGNVRPYKNIPGLLSSFKQLTGDNMRLVVAGNVADTLLRLEIEDRVRADSRVALRVGLVSPTDVAVLYGAADLAVFPFSEILNSGSAILALSMGCPILVPEIGAMADLWRAAGSEWVMLYAGELTPEILLSALMWSATDRTSKVPDLGALDWKKIARDTFHLYKTVCARDSLSSIQH